MNLNCRILTTNDHALVNEAVSWHDSRYGHKLDKDRLELDLIDFLSRTNQDYVVGCFDDSNLVGINSHKAWEIAPFWTFGRLFIKPSDQGQGIMTKYQLSVTKILSEFNCELGEKNKRYDWFTVSLDSSKTDKPRDSIFLEDVYKRYNVNHMYRYNPDEDCQWGMFNGIYNKNLNPHKRPILLRMLSLKNELRPI